MKNTQVLNPSNALPAATLQPESTDDMTTDFNLRSVVASREFDSL